MHLKFAELPNRRGAFHLGRTRMARSEVSTPHRHDFHELFLVEQGRGRHVCNTRVDALSPACLVLVQPEDTHHFVASPDDPLCFINLAVSGDWWTAFVATLSPAVSTAELASAAAQPQRLEPLRRAQCQRAIAALWDDRQRDPAGLSAAVAQCLGMLLAAAAEARLPPPDWLRQWHQALFNGELPGPALSEWQARSGVSAEHLARSCRKHYGDSPSSLLNRARIAWVQERLRPGVSVLDLALEAGFDNLGWFYRCFNRFAGITPKAWRDQQQGGGAVPTNRP
jgi:AraC family transcriptional regulator, dual regulator of chb operon